MNKLNSYNGKLCPEKITEGINACNKNALNLLNDANLLHKNCSYPTATSLAILAIEEIGKIPILRRLAVVNDDKEVKKCWKEFRFHTKKNILWIVPILISEGARRLYDLEKVTDSDSEHPYILNNLKQLGFYTDCLGNCNWSIPAEIIDEKVSNEIIEIANLLINEKQITLEEIELWIKHMDPVWNTSQKSMEEALINWSKEVAASGINNYDGMKEFVQGGLKMLYIDENDIKNIKFQVIMQVAKKLDLSFTTANEAYKKIENMDKDLYDKMRAFIKAYENWFEFHKKLDSLDKQGNLNNREKDKLEMLIKKRKKTNKELSKKIHSIQI